jgi:hypothetical protein
VIKLLYKICTSQESLGLVEYGLIILPSIILILLKAGTAEGKQFDENCNFILDILNKVQLGMLAKLIENDLNVTLAIGNEVVGIIIIIVEPEGKLSIICIFSV